MVLLPSYLFSAFNPNKLPNKAQVMDNLGLRETYEKNLHGNEQLHDQRKKI